MRLYTSMAVLGLCLGLGACFQEPQAVSTSSSSQSQSSSSEFLRIGYWPYYTPVPKDSQLQNWNHVMVFSVTPDENGQIDSSHIDDLTLKDLIQRAHRLGVKVGLSVGGYGMSESFIAVASTPTARETFAQKVVEFAKVRNMDGIDLDWEYPDTTLGENLHYRDLIGAVRRASQPLGLSLSINVHRVSSHFANLNPDSVDWIQIMSYDQSKGIRNGMASKGENGNYQESLEQLDFWHQKIGFPKNKIVLGMPAYGVTLKDGSPIYTLSYEQLPWTDPSADSAKFEDRMYYLNGPLSVSKKVQFLKSQGYKGYMFWEISQDKSDSFSLFQSALKAAQ